MFLNEFFDVFFKKIKKYERK